MNQCSEYRYSMAIKTDDEAILHCLRALSMYSQATGNNRIPWGGTKKGDWKLAKHCVKFHFTTSNYRQAFIKELFRLLPENLWEKKEEKDNDPAVPNS